MTAEQSRDGLPRVLFAIGGLGLGGSEQQLVEVMCGGHGSAFDASLITIEPTVAEQHAQRLRDAGIAHHRLERPLRGNRLLRAAIMAPRLVAHLRGIRPDVVYTWLEETSLYLAPIARMQGIPLIVARRNVCGARVERYLPARMAIRAVERSAALVTANSDAAVREARRRGVRSDRIRLVRNGHAPVDPLPLPDDGVVRLGYVAQLRAEKGHLRLFETLRRVSTTAPWQVDLAGDGVLRAHLTRVAASSGLSDRVRFLGEIDDVRAFWARQHIGLLLSDTEGSPNALIEAALAGRPLVATATGGTPDVVGPAGGFLVGLDDPDAGARAIESLIDDGELRRRLGAEAHLQARGRFALDASVDGHVQAIHEVLRARGGYADERVMAVVFATNINVFTAPEVSPLNHEVVSWAWRDGSQTVAQQRAAMEAETGRALRRFPDADVIARAYHAHKAILPGRGARSALRATLWTLQSVRRADRVLLAAPPPGVDRIIWLVAFVAARLLRRPLFVYSEVWIEPVGRSHRAARLLQRVLRGSATRILVPGDVHRAHHVARGVPPERIALIDSIYCPRPPAQRLLPAPAAASDRPFTFLYVGRLLPCKGLERLLRIVARVARSEPRVRLLVVAGRPDQYMGADPEYGARCRRLIAEAESGTVTLVEHRDDIDAVYAQADALVMPNEVIRDDRVPADSWGRVVEEALLHGLPVISTDAVPAARELVVPGVNGQIVPWQSDRALEDALVAAASGLDAGGAATRPVARS